MNELFRLISKLTTFKASAQDNITIKNYSGKGKIDVSLAENSITLNAIGTWNDGIISPNFTFSYRFLIKSDQALIIEHTRYGEEQAVYLCELKKVSENKFPSTAPHVCNEDLYSAEILLKDNSLLLNWNITGPNKDMVLKYYFF